MQEAKNTKFIDKNRTFSIKQSEIEKKWKIIDAEGQVLGRLATKVAMMLRGKHKASFTPHMDMGDYVIVINAEKVQVSGRKETDKLYRWHSMHPGGLKQRTYEQMLEKFPERIVEMAIKGMLPKNKLGRKIFTNLKVYKGAQHPHQAQKPETVTL